MDNKHSIRLLIFIPILCCIIFCSGCSRLPIQLQNDTDDLIFAIFVEREPPDFKATYYDHEFVNSGETKRYHGYHNIYQITGYVKLYSPHGLIGIWPVKCGDKITIRKSLGKGKIEVIHDTSGRDYGVLPLNTYASFRTSEEFNFYIIWILIISVIWLIPLALIAFIDNYFRKESSLLSKLTKNSNRRMIGMSLFIILAITASYLISMLGVTIQKSQENRFVNKIRILETINNKLLKEKETSGCNYGKQ